jgi:hypothetical protein
MKALALSAMVSVGASLWGIQQEISTLEPIEALPEHLVYLYSNDFGAPPDDVQRQLFANARRWEIGRVLRVCTFGGNEVVATLIRQAASEWNQYSGVKFEFGSAASGFNCLDPRSGYFQVRIGFFGRGYWSALGNDSETRLDAHAPSMNLEGFNRIYSPGRMSSSTVFAQADRYHIATIKHEFGHALALLHEHQNPGLNCHAEINWDGAGNVYEFLAQPPNSWTRDMVDRNLGFIAQTDPDYVSGKSDPSSIMMYSLPAQVFRRANSPCQVDRNFDISDKDRQIVGKIYPISRPTNAPAPSDLNLASAKIRPAVAPVTVSEFQDAKERILADLQSDDVIVRRDARARLADILSKLPTAEATELIQRAQNGSYRLQLGLAVGVNNAPATFRLSSEAKSVLVDSAKAAKDSTLRAELGKATRR